MVVYEEARCLSPHSQSEGHRYRLQGHLRPSDLAVGWCIAHLSTEQVWFVEQ